MGSASESKIAGARANAKKGITNIICLLEMNHPQESTLLELDDAIAHSMLTKTLAPKQSKAIRIIFF